MKTPAFPEDKFKPLDYSRFEKLRNEKLRPQLNLDGLRLLRLQALRERDLRELYRNRAPYELLQNADDVNAQMAIFILSPEGLVFAHDGAWFTVDNLRNLAEGWSDKDPKQCIGHKGLGFRSVLDITPAPHLLKVDVKDFLGIKFTWASNHGHIQETLHKDPSLTPDHKDWTKHGQPYCPVISIPNLVKKKQLPGGVSIILDSLAHGKYGGQFTTMFWFPAKDPEIDLQVLTELSPRPIKADQDGRQIMLGYLQDEVSVLLPFLKSIKEVRVYESDWCIGSASISGEIKDKKEGEIAVVTEIKGQRECRSFFQMRFFSNIPPHIRNQPDTPTALKWLDRATITLSARIEDGQPTQDQEARFHVYFPTEELTGTGFVIHGDFHIKPDRTRLMSGHYNQWLLDTASKKAANEFLTRLLEKYRARSVYTALSPTRRSTTDITTSFIHSFSKALSERPAPFIPTRIGLLKQSEAALPPTVDESGFWDDHFADLLNKVIQGKKAFLTPEEDGHGTRTFLQLAGVTTLESKSFLDLIEIASQQNKPATWWYECYSYIAANPYLSQHDRSFFAGRKLIPLANLSVISVVDDSSLVVCLPPAKDTTLKVPDCFSNIFVFLNSELVDLLEEGKDTIKSWVLDRFHISRFEASDLLPRAIRGIVQQIFSSELAITAEELKGAWLFMKSVVESSRTILSTSFWNEIGRFPLPLNRSNTNGLSPEILAPAFLTYWPDSFMVKDSCLLGIMGLRRADEAFLNQLIVESKVPPNEWIDFFEKVGVSNTLKLLRYSRVVGRGHELPFAPDSPGRLGIGKFSGERQLDENRAVLETLRREPLWSEITENPISCGHDFQKVLQSMNLLEGLDFCTELADQEYRNGNDIWRTRLFSLIRSLPTSSLSACDTDMAFCRGGNGHSISLGYYFQKQLDYYPWLPSSLGPANRQDSFVRFSSRRLISSGFTGEELGDKLLPYVVVDNINDQAILQNLGVGVLDDASSARPVDLIRALQILGDRLSTEWGKNEILSVKSRWRLVRGAIQEIYRALNQSGSSIQCPPDLKIACRRPDGVEFSSSPLYYAESGSAIETAFLGALPLVDADRPYPQLFDQLAITRLISGQTVKETFLGEKTSVQALILHKEIMENLAPFLLAPIVARSEKENQGELILRKLKDRFEVRATDRLTVSFSLRQTPSINRIIEFRKFYLRTRLIQSSSAIREEHYNLYVSGSDTVSLDNLDGDALGEALSPIFTDRVGDELSGLFPRIVSRFQQVQGNRNSMEEFMYHQLHISKEALDMAWAMVFGPTEEERPITILATPPIKVIKGKEFISESEGEQRVQEMLSKHQKRLEEKTNVILELVTQASKKEAVPRSGHRHATGQFVGSTDEITPEQRERGKKGEEEIKRRLELPGGWEGFTLVADKRNAGCGYDFLCSIGDQEAKVEVKTFIKDGRIVLTTLELQEAAASNEEYYLIGMLDDEKPPHMWSVFLIRNPIDTLLTKGEFDIQTKLQAKAADIFDL